MAISNNSVSSLFSSGNSGISGDLIVQRMTLRATGKAYSALLKLQKAGQGESDSAKALSGTISDKIYGTGAKDTSKDTSKDSSSSSTDKDTVELSSKKPSKQLLSEKLYGNNDTYDTSKLMSEKLYAKSDDVDPSTLLSEKLYKKGNDVDPSTFVSEKIYGNNETPKADNGSSGVDVTA